MPGWEQDGETVPPHPGHGGRSQPFVANEQSVTRKIYSSQVMCLSCCISEGPWRLNPPLGMLCISLSVSYPISPRSLWKHLPLGAYGVPNAWSRQRWNESDHKFVFYSSLKTLTCACLRQPPPVRTESSLHQGHWSQGHWPLRGSILDPLIEWQQ